jgi:hypothetical protein
MGGVGSWKVRDVVAIHSSQHVALLQSAIDCGRFLHEPLVLHLEVSAQARCKDAYRSLLRFVLHPAGRQRRSEGGVICKRNEKLASQRSRESWTRTVTRSLPESSGHTMIPTVASGSSSTPMSEWLAECHGTEGPFNGERSVDLIDEGIGDTAAILYVSLPNTSSPRKRCKCRWQGGEKTCVCVTVKLCLVR